jgi:hypothetical protein
MFQSCIITMLNDIDNYIDLKNDPVKKFWSVFHNLN